MKSGTDIHVFRDRYTSRGTDIHADGIVIQVFGIDIHREISNIAAGYDSLRWISTRPSFEME